MRQPTPTPLTKERVIDRLLRCTGGQIVACNIVAGLENHLFDPAWVARILAWMGKLGAYAGYAGPEQLVRALDDLRTRRYPRAVSSSLSEDPPDIRLGGAQAPGPFDVPVTCVLPTWVVGNVMSESDKDRLAREGLVMPMRPADISNSTVDDWRGAPASLRTARLGSSSRLGYPRSIVWFTRREQLEATLAKDGTATAELAHRARDLLGLVHHEQNVVLAAMHFSSTSLAAYASARPTFADAGGHGRFKAWPDGASARSCRSWGSTVDLGALADGSKSVDGCPERVMKSIDGSEAKDVAFEFELLGAVLRPSAQTTDGIFAERLLNGRTVVQLGADLKALINS